MTSWQMRNRFSLSFLRVGVRIIHYSFRTSFIRTVGGAKQNYNKKQIIWALSFSEWKIAPLVCVHSDNLMSPLVCLCAWCRSEDSCRTRGVVGDFWVTDPKSYNFSLFLGFGSEKGWALAHLNQFDFISSHKSLLFFAQERVHFKLRSDISRFYPWVHNVQWFIRYDRNVLSLMFYYLLAFSWLQIIRHVWFLLV